MQKKVFQLLVDNTSGVLSRISGLFSRRGYNIEKSDYSSHYIINSIILHTQRVQHHPTHIETYQHHQQRTEIEEQGILCDPLVIF